MKHEKALYEVEAEKLRDATVYIMLQMEQAVDEAPGVNRVRVRGPQWKGDDYVLMAGGLSDDGTAIVAFSSASTLHGALIGFANRMRNGTLKWHVDKYAQQP
jgi:hypothetical protein